MLFYYCRKNPAHFKEYSHPSKNDDDEEGGEAAAADSDDDRPECPYGTSCYRRNPQHKRDFKHTETPGELPLDTSCHCVYIYIYNPSNGFASVQLV